MRLGRSITYLRKSWCQGQFGIWNAECGIILNAEIGMRNAEIEMVECLNFIISTFRIHLHRQPVFNHMTSDVFLLSPNSYLQ